MELYHIGAAGLSVILAFIFLRPRRMKELLPAAIVCTILVLAIEVYVLSLGMYNLESRYEFLDIPLASYVWTFFGIMIFIGSLRWFRDIVGHKFWGELVAAVIFGFIIFGHDMVALHFGALERSPKFTNFHNYINNLRSMMGVVWVAGGLFAHRTYIPKQRESLLK